MNRFIRNLERLFENGLWLLRFITIIPVIFSAIGAIVLFYVGSIEIIDSFKAILNVSEETEQVLPKVMSGIIGGIDVYLIGVVMILFSYGIYELFISKIDVGRTENTEVQLLTITSLDQLKDKILKVIVMVVGLFKRLLELEIKTYTDILFWAISILLIACSSYLMKTNDNH